MCFVPFSVAKYQITQILSDTKFQQDKEACWSNFTESSGSLINCKVI